MININSTKKLLLEYLNDAATGQVKFSTNDGSAWKFSMHFFSKIEGVSNATDTELPELQVPNLETLVSSLNEYLQVATEFYINDKTYFDLTDEGFVKKLISDLFASATNYDFQDFINFVNKRKQMLELPLEKTTLNLGTINGSDINANIKKNQSNLEGPFDMELSITKGTDEYILPSVTFGLADTELYIYAIKLPNKTEKDKISGDVKKTIIDGVPVLDTPFKIETDKFLHGITKNSHAKGTDRNISPTALVSLSLFLSIFKDSNSFEVVAPDFMPVRYLNNRIAIYNRYMIDEDIAEEMLEAHDNNQNNITNKFMYLFSRYNHHFPECEMFYDDIRQEMRMKLSKTKSTGENLIYNIDKTQENSLEKS